MFKVDETNLPQMMSPTHRKFHLLEDDNREPMELLQLFKGTIMSVKCVLCFT